MKYPHFAYPFRFSRDVTGTHVVVHEQDSVDEVFDCVQVIVRYPVGFRKDLPEFGITDQVFQEGGLDLGLLQAEIYTWEPRSDAEIDQRIAESDALSTVVRARIFGGEEI